MTPCSHRVPGLLLALGFVIATGPVHGTGGHESERSLRIDPRTFAPVEAGATDESFQRRGRSLVVLGPQIVLRMPEDDSTFAPSETISVHLEFLPAADGIAPNMKTLTVRVRKGWFGKDITQEVEPFIDGTAVYVPAVDFSGHTGKFQFDIRIRDFEDRVGEARFRVWIQGLSTGSRSR